MAAADPFQAIAVGRESPAVRAFAITPSDVAELTYVTRAIRVNLGGTIKMQLRDDADGITHYAADGEWLPVAAKKIWSTGTTASQIVGYL